MTAYVFKRVKDYYKYEYQDWTQPIMTANGTMGGDTFAASQTGFSDAGLEAYRAFDNNTSTVCYFAKSTGYFQWYNPNPLKITNLKLTNYIGDSWGTRALTSGSIQVSNDGSDFVELKTFTNSVTGGGENWNIDLSSNTGYYKYYRIVCTGTSYAVANAANQCHIAELKITATEQITVKGSATDYDFRTSKAYVLKRKRPKEYRKKVIDTATAGTYTFDVAKDTTARIILVGGGGAGGQVWEGHAEGSGGGSGACVYCKVKLNAGTYTITNGAAGVFPRGNAGNSTLSLGDTTLITAGGGTGGRDSGGAVGVGGTYSFADGVEIEKIFFASNGNNGVVGGNMWGGTGGASVYKGYGAGGNSRTGGNAGYIFVELTTDDTDYDYKIDNDACYVLKRKQYWKYGTEPNVTVVGSPTIDNGVVSGFNASNYLTLPMDFNPSSSPWSITTAIHFVDGSSGQRIFGSKGDIYGLALQTHTSTKTLHLYGSSNGSFWNLMSDLKGVTPLVDGTDYWVKMEYSGSQYIVSLSTNGVNWNDEITVNNATPLYAFKTFYIGSNTVETFLFGSIDLTQSFVKINNKLWWNGVKAIKATKDDYDFTTD